jgi:hypothetical protein
LNFQLRHQQRPLVAHYVGSHMRYIHFLPCYGLPVHLASFSSSSLLFALYYLLGVSRGLLFVSLLVASLPLDDFPAEYLFYTRHNAELEL